LKKACKINGKRADQLVKKGVYEKSAKNFAGECEIFPDDSRLLEKSAACRYSKRKFHYLWKKRYDLCLLIIRTEILTDSENKIAAPRRADYY
jgi:hypothetical protein